VYAAAGLGIFFFAIMIWRGYEYHLAKKDPDGETDGIAHAHIIHVYKKKLIQTLGFCILFFVVIAGSIYVMSYIPFQDSYASNADRFYTVTDPTWEGFDWYKTVVTPVVNMLREHSGNPVAEVFGRMLNNQHSMYQYHHDLTSTHPFQSSWNEWPAMIRPMYYYCQTLTNGLKEGISAFGNPLVWWAGIPALILILLPLGRRISPKLGTVTSQWLQCAGCEVLVFLALWSVYAKPENLSTADSSWSIYGPILIVVGILASLYIAFQLVPWVLVPRCTFAYHYFPSVPFVTMIVVYCMVKLVDYNKKWLKWCMVYLGVAFLLFLIFYPVLSGQPILEGMARDTLRWMDGWQLVS
jgi:hypothetical protein